MTDEQRIARLLISAVGPIKAQKFIAMAKTAISNSSPWIEHLTKLQTGIRDELGVFCQRCQSPIMPRRNGKRKFCDSSCRAMFFQETKAELARSQKKAKKVIA